MWQLGLFWRSVVFDVDAQGMDRRGEEVIKCFEDHAVSRCACRMVEAFGFDVYDKVAPSMFFDASVAGMFPGLIFNEQGCGLKCCLQDIPYVVAGVIALHYCFSCIARRFCRFG